MKAEFILFSPTNKEYNRNELAKDVAGVKCIYVGRIGEGSFMNKFGKLEIYQHLPTFHHLSTCELYANGRANWFARDENEQVIGFIRVTPEPEEHMWYSNEEGMLTGGTPISEEDKLVHTLLNQTSNIIMFTGYQIYEIECLLRDAYRTGVQSWTT